MPRLRTPRLPLLDPEAIGRTAPPHVGASELARLCRWAQTGQGLSAAEARRVLALVCQALHPEGGDLDAQVRAADPRTELGQVVLGAAARLELAERQSVRPVRLAAVAGLSERQVWNVLRSRELVGERGRVPAMAARAWLEQRGVPGF